MSYFPASLFTTLGRAGLPTAPFVALVLDTETGGVFEDENGGYEGSASTYGLTQIGMVLIEVSAQMCIRQSQRIIVESPAHLRLEGEALAIQGHTPESWAALGGKVDEDSAMERFCQFQKLVVAYAEAQELPCYMVGHNLEFHLAFLLAMATRVGADITQMPLWSDAYRFNRIDTMLAFRSLREQGLFPEESSASLRHIAAELFRAPSRVGTVHDAERDALVCSRVLGGLYKAVADTSPAWPNTSPALPSASPAMSLVAA